MTSDEWNAGRPVTAYPDMLPEHPPSVAHRKRAEENRAFGAPDLSGVLSQLESITGETSG